MTIDDPKPSGGLDPEVATAPQPVLTITGHTAVISRVRFVWHGTYCGWCRKSVALWTDGGTIDVGLQPGRVRRRTAATGAHWYQTYRPCGVPAIPDDCPHPGCHRPATRMLAGFEVPTGWLDGTWRLVAGPFTVAPRIDEHGPDPVPWARISPLLDQVWSTLRRIHPDLAAAADADAAEQHRRAQRG